MTSIARDALSLIGNTPLVRLAGPSAETGCEILAKCEFMNPGGSVKDRAALYIIQDGEARGLLEPGGTIVEGTAGNTGIGLAFVANAKGYRTIIVIPETQSQEKKDTLRALGAELVEVPPTAYSNPAHYVHTSRRIAEETPGGFWSNQFDNTANRLAHIRTTAPEIWTQTGGDIDGFTCACGTGGTLAGVGLGLKAEKESITIALTDPHGASLYSYYQCGELSAEGSSVAEGIGQSRITANLEGAPVDAQFRVSDADALVWVHRLLAASILGMLGQDEPHGARFANGAVSNGAAADQPKEPLAELGIAPGGNQPKTAAPLPAARPIVTIPPPPAPHLPTPAPAHH